MVIDAHQHFWTLGQFDTRWLETKEHAKIRRNYGPEHLAKLIRPAGVAKTVFVQTQHNVEENRWVLKLAEEHDFLCGVVGWVDLASEKCAEQLAEFTSHPKFVGVRHVTQGEPDDDFIVRPEILRGLKVLERAGVPFDLLFYVKHLRHVPRLASELPNLKMVIDHLSKPEIKGGRMDNWEGNFRAAGKFENVFCKLSGMITEGDWEKWTVSDLRPYAELALEVFGPRRLMFGSDWPVCELAGSYQEVVSAARELTNGLSESERGEIFGGTVKWFYNLRV